MTTVWIANGLRYGFRFLGLSLALVLVCGAVVAGGGAFAWTGLDAANPANSQFLRVAAGGLVALVGTLSLLGVTAGLLHKFLADSVSAGIETAALEEQLTPDGAAETTAVGDSESAPDTDTDAGAVPGADGRAGEAAVEPDRRPDAGETSPDPASSEVTPEAAEARARDVLEGNEATTADTTSQRPATNVAAEVEQTAEGPGGDADETSAEVAPEPSSGEPRETTADEWQSGDEIGGADSTSTRDSDRGEEPRGEELDRLVSEATDPDGGPDPATDPDAWSPAGEPARDTVDGAVSGADAGDAEGGPFSETDAPSSPGSGAERTADVSEPTDDEHGGASPGGDEDGFEPDFEDVEDTTDEPGDWKPLDEDDL